jgi:radical SAM superfamily enzyme YgiQ (UPF0313 family)
MRIELINLPFSYSYHRRLDPPLFLLQLAPILEEQGFKIRVNDLNGLDKSQWCFGHCVIYAVYIDNDRYNLMKRVISQCKNINPSATVIACGSGPSKNISKFVNDDGFDVVIRGEPEIAIKSFMNDYIRTRDKLPKVYKSEVKDINRLPLPSRHLIDVNSYYRKLDGKKAIMILGSRGSPYRPTWICSGHKVFSTSRIMNEVESIHNAYGIRCFFFGDEAFCFDKQRAISLAKLMNEKGFSFGFNDNIQNVNIELYKKLAYLGCKELMLNLFGNKSATYIDSMRSKIEEDTGIKVILRKESKYSKSKENKE